MISFHESPIIQALLVLAPTSIWEIRSTENRVWSPMAIYGKRHTGMTCFGGTIQHCLICDHVTTILPSFPSGRNLGPFIPNCSKLRHSCNLKLRPYDKNLVYRTKPDCINRKLERNNVAQRVSYERTTAKRRWYLWHSFEGSKLTPWFIYILLKGTASLLPAAYPFLKIRSQTPWISTCKCSRRSKMQ